MTKAKYGYYAGNMDPGLLEAQKMDCNGRKFKGLTPQQLQMWIYTRILIERGYL
jgi:hypothetical protein